MRHCLYTDNHEVIFIASDFISMILAFLHIPEVVEQLQDNYKYWQARNTEDDSLNNPSNPV